MFILIATLFLLGFNQGQCSLLARVKLHANDASTYHGSLTFWQDSADSPVRIYGTVIGLNSSSAHGFHIHANPVATDAPNCTAAGPHFNPYNVIHGSPTADIDHRHVGDLGNITTDENGNADIAMSDYIIQLYNETQSIVKRSVVIHLYRDDGGQGGFPDSNTTGNAGARLICGLILLSSDEPTTTTTTISTSSTSEHTSSETSDTTTTGTISVASTTNTGTITATITSTTTTLTATTENASNTTMTIVPTTATGKNLQPIVLLLFIIMIITHRISS